MSPAEPRNLDPFEAWLWGAGDDVLASLRLDELHHGTQAAGIDLPQLTVLTVITDAATAFETLQGSASGLLGSREVGDGGGLLWTRLRRQDYLVGVWPTRETGVYHLVGSAPVTDHRWRRVETTWLRQAAPKLSPLTLNENDFEAIGDALMEHGDVEVSRLTARVLEDHSSYYRGWHSELVRQRPTHREALREAEDMLVRTLTLSIRDRLSIHLRRHAGATFYRGNYELFAQVVLRRLAQAAGARRALLSDRARTPREPVTETIALRVPPEVMAAEAGRKDLMRVLGHVRGVQTAVYHVNPYLHFGVTDYLDGSTFDVFVTENDRVEVVPGLNASLGSLARITEAMGDAVGMIAMDEHDVPSLLSDEELLVAG